MSARERLAARCLLERLGAGVDRIRNLGETMHDERCSNWASTSWKVMWIKRRAAFAKKPNTRKTSP